MRRQLGLVTRSFEEMADAMALFGNAVMSAISTISEAVARFEVIDLGIPGVIAVQDRHDGTYTFGVDPGSPYPTRSGVEDGREAHSAAERIDASAAALGIELTPLQHHLAIKLLTGNVVTAPRAFGKWAAAEVAAHALRGPEIQMAWVDEAVAWTDGAEVEQ